MRERERVQILEREGLESREREREGLEFPTRERRDFIFS